MSEYKSFGLKVDSRGAYVFGPELTSPSRYRAALDRNLILSEMSSGKRVYSSALTFLHGKLYRQQSIPGAVAR